MADKTITQLTELTAVDKNDIMYVVDDPSGSPISKKMTVANALLAAKTLTSNTSVATTDGLLLIDDPSGSASPQFTTVSELFKGFGLTKVTNSDLDNNAVLSTGIATGSGLLLVTVSTDSYVALYRVEGSTLTAISANTNFSTAKDTVSKYNVYFETTEYKVQNKVADNKVVSAYFLRG